MALSFLSRTTSISNSFQPNSDSSNNDTSVPLYIYDYNDNVSGKVKIKGSRFYDNKYDIYLDVYDDGTAADITFELLSSHLSGSSEHSVQVRGDDIVSATISDNTWGLDVNGDVDIVGESGYCDNYLYYRNLVNQL